MKEHNFELIRGDDYAFLFKLKLPSNFSIDILSCKFRLQARKMQEDNSSIRRNTSAILPRGQFRQQLSTYNDNYQTPKSENELVLSLDTENQAIKILDNGDIVLIFSHNDTDSADWKVAKYDLQMITNAGKYKTIMKGKITLLQDITE